MAEERVQRRLAAILAADVVGYSRLMEADEEGTRARLRTVQSELIDPRIASDGGRIVKTTGDGILVEFPSAVDAVRNALAMQSAMEERNAALPDDKKLVFRIGINVGDVIIEGDDIHGDGVNVAARLEGLCQPGEVYISGTVHDHVQGKLSAHFEDLGDQAVKNITRPVRAYRVQPQSASAPDAADRGEPLALPDKPSIAVLPFENMSGDPEQEYFSDGITEDIITDLSKISGLFVIARNSSFSYKGETIDIRRVARELGVRNVLEGSVRRAGSQVRITAQLIDAVSGGHLWAERYDGDLDNIFSLQDEIAGKIVAALEVTLTEGEREREQNSYVPNWEAYDCFIKGRFIVSENYFRFSQHSGETPSDANLLSARHQFERAIELDPRFAGGFAGLSWVYALGVRHGLSISPEADREKAIQLAEQAIDIDSDFGWSHTALSSSHLAQRRHQEAIISAKQAIELQPNDSDGYAYLGFSLICAGNPKDALPPLQEALRLDPRFQPRTRAFLGLAYFGLHKFEKAAQELELVTGPLNYVIHFYLAFMSATYVQLGRTKDARDTVARLLNLYPKFTVDTFRRLFPYKNPTDTEFVCRDLVSAGLPDKTDKKDEPLPLPDKPSIAVLPFDNMSADAEQEYFSDGITEDIITELSKISGLFVIARHSAFTFKGKSVTLKQVGEDLGVRYVLEGSVRKAGNRLRITAQLINAETDHHLWAERYDRDIEDIFAVQDEVARCVADALAVALQPGEREILAHAPTDNLEAYDLYLRARTTPWPPSRSNILSAQNVYARVIDVDPAFAGGHAGKSITHSLAVLFGHSDQREDDARLALELAEKAVALDPEFARSHSAMGQAYSALGEHDKAVAASARAIALQPGDADSHAFYARVLLFSGDGEKASEAINTALRLDPQYVEGPYLNLLGRAHFTAGRYDDAIEAYERNLARGGPNSAPGMSSITWAAAYGLADRLADARRLLETEVLRAHPGFTVSRLKQLRTPINSHERNRMIEGLRKAGLPE